MIRRIGVFLIVSLAGFLVAYVPMGFLIQKSPVEVIVLAAVVCLAPGALVLATLRALRDKPAEARIVGVLFATVVRMFGVIGIGCGFYAAISVVREHIAAFVSWGIVFYIVALIIETRLLYIDNSGAASQDPRSLG